MRIISTLIIITLIFPSCKKAPRSKQPAATANTINYSTVTFDSLTLKQLVLENDKLLGIVRVALFDWEKSKKLNELIQSDSFRIMLYQRATFNIERDIRCNGSRHLYIAKKEVRHPAIAEQTNSEFLVMINDSGKAHTVEELREHSFYSDGRKTSDSIIWTIDADSLIRTSRYQVTVSDMVIEGQEPYSAKKITNKTFKLSCEELKLISTDSTGWVGI